MRTDAGSRLWDSSPHSCRVGLSDLGVFLFGDEPAFRARIKGSRFIGLAFALVFFPQRGVWQHHLGRGIKHLGCSRICITASYFFLTSARHRIQCLWAQSWMAVQHGQPSNMFGDIRTRLSFARPRVHSSERPDHCAASYFPCTLVPWCLYYTVFLPLAFRCAFSQ